SHATAIPQWNLRLRVMIYRKHVRHEVFSVIKKGTPIRVGWMERVGALWDGRKMVVTGGREIATPLLKSRPGGSTALAREPMEVEDRSGTHYHQAAVSSTAASFSAGVRPWSAIENRTSLYSRSHAGNAAAAAS